MTTRRLIRARSIRRATQPPELVLRLPLDGQWRGNIVADTEADERQLRRWLAVSPHVLDDVAGRVRFLLERLDARDEERRAA